MPIDETPRPPSGAPAGNVIANDASIDDIVSVNTRGRRSGGRAAPFVVIGGIALVVLIGLLLTVNVVSSKMAGPKPAQPTSGAAQSGLTRRRSSLAGWRRGGGIVFGGRGLPRRIGRQ
jgi:hypothetical protein